MWWRIALTKDTTYPPSNEYFIWRDGGVVKIGWYRAPWDVFSGYWVIPLQWGWHLL